jgi:hypothetical protein
VRPGETGLLAKPRDSADLARKLVQLMGDRELFQKLSDGCLAAVGDYSKVKHLDSLEGVFANAQSLGPRQASLRDDAELSDSLHRVFDTAKMVEDWANGMNTHIEYLERGGIKWGITWSARMWRKLGLACGFLRQ